ncbi:MAG: NAD(P)/FAD-dependent oxidoreductase [Hyphomicrobium sp.]|jgi:L-2-hydroxyglutarate oxidase LhgO
MPDVETVVIGAGVVGLAIARALAMAGHEVLVLERHSRIGSEASSRNSEVIHAGLYYPPGSLRATLCVAGKEMLYRFCRENGVAHKRCGKLLVATSEAEVPRLETIAANAVANGVADLQRLGAGEARSLEPALECVAAYLSPSTGIVDSHGLMQALHGHLAARGGEVVLNTAVTGIASRDGMFAMGTASGGEQSTLTSRNLVISAGLGATDLGRTLAYRSGYRVPATYPARGHYFALDRGVPFRHLVYPMPVGAWLGVHLTLDVAGRARFGPDIEWCDEPDYKFDEDQGRRLKRFEAEIRRYWPALPQGALHPDTVGVRPKLYREGEPVADFAIHGKDEHGVDRLVTLYGIESPGLTSSLAIGEYVTKLLS